MNCKLPSHQTMYLCLCKGFSLLSKPDLSTKLWTTKASRYFMRNCPLNDTFL